MPIQFVDQQYFLLLILLVPLLLFWHLRQPRLGHSRLSVHSSLPNLRLVSKLPAISLALAMIAIVCALARPVTYNTIETQTVDSRDIVVAVDNSGSMDSQISTSTNCGGDIGICKGLPANPKKIDLARAAVKYLIGQRKGDFIAITSFDDNMYYYWPLSDDQHVLQLRADNLTYTGGGTNFDGPAADASGIGPIQAAINLLTKYGKAKTKIFIMVTDGGSTISPDRMVALQTAMEQLGVHMYVLGVGDDWVGNDSSTQDLRTFVNGLHGTIINAGNPQELQAGIDAISKMEPSHFTIERAVKFDDKYLYFIAAALVLFAFFHVLNAATRRAS
jgi:hypothetical protein